MMKLLSDKCVFIRQVPTKEELNELIHSVELIFQPLQEKIEDKLLPENLIANLKEVFEKQKAGLDFGADGVVGKDDGTTWLDIEDCQKRKIYWQIAMVRRGLLDILTPDLRRGFWLLIFFAALLVGSLVWYVSDHLGNYYQGHDAAVVEQIKKARIQLASMAAVIEKIDENTDEDLWQLAVKKSGDLQKALVGLKLSSEPEPILGILILNIEMKDLGAARLTIKDLQKTFEEKARGLTPFDSGENISLHQLFVSLESAIGNVEKNADDSEKLASSWKKLATRYEKFVDALLSLPISYDTEKKMGRLQAAINDQNINLARKAIAEIQPYFETDMQNLKESFFYTSNPMKWLEIASWAWFGVLVGIIFYLGKQLKNGVFDKQDVPAIISEIIMAPIVTCVVFFLFNLSGLTTFSPAEGSIIVILGCAFMFGYAIRRTVGLLDNIKKRLLPNP